MELAIAIRSVRILGAVEAVQGLLSPPYHDAAQGRGRCLRALPGVRDSGRRAAVGHGAMTNILTRARRWGNVFLSRQNPRPGFDSRNHKAPRRSFCSAFFVPAMVGRAGAPSGAPLSFVGGKSNPVRSATLCRFDSAGGLTSHKGTVRAQKLPVSTTPISTYGRRSARHVSGRQAQRQHRDRLEAGCRSQLPRRSRCAGSGVGRRPAVPRAERAGPSGLGFVARGQHEQ